MKKDLETNYQEKLLNIKDQILHRLSWKDNEVTELSYIDNHPADTSDEEWERLKDQVLENEDIKRLQEVEDAIKKIQENSYENSYGICESCSSIIDRNRLDIIPYTRYCSSCAGKIKEKISLDPKIRPMKERFAIEDNRGNIWEQIEVYGSSGQIYEENENNTGNISDTEDGRESGIVQQVEKEKDEEY